MAGMGGKSILGLERGFRRILIQKPANAGF